jgi:hypothetical protein
MFLFLLFPVTTSPILEQIKQEGIRLDILTVKEFICYYILTCSKIAAWMLIAFIYHLFSCSQWKFVLNIRHKAKLTLHVLVQVAFLVALCCPFISSFVVLLLVIILFFPVVHKFDWGIEESEVEIFLARSWFWTRLRYFWGALARLQS